MAGVQPVFFKAKEVRCTIYEVCAASEKVIGQAEQTVKGVQFIGELVRIYLLKEQWRVELLRKGLVVNGVKVDLVARNPFLLRGSDGEDIPVTKLFVGNVPISYSDDDILKGLEKIGMRRLSKMDMERVRGPDGKLTNWITGRRMMWIEVPKVPLPRVVDCGLFRASLFYKEMLKELECRRCFGKGHYAKDCVEQERCRKCRNVGHRMVDCEVGSAWGKDMVNDEERMKEMVCHKCKRKGHKARDCLEQRCWKCREYGHNMTECRKEIDNGSDGEEIELESSGKGSASKVNNVSGSTNNERGELLTEGESGVKSTGGGKNGRKFNKVNKGKAGVRKEETPGELEEEDHSEEEDEEISGDGIKKGNVKGRNGRTRVPNEEGINEKRERGRQLMKDAKANTLDRYVSRSESRKRVKTPEHESKRQRVKLTEDDNAH